MTQPMLRTKLTHDPASMEGQAYVPFTIALTLDGTSGSGVKTLYTVPAGFYLKEATCLILTGFNNSATIDIGLDGDTDAIIDNTEITEATPGNAASSKQTTLPDGLLFTALDVLVAEIAGGVPTTGKALILLEFLDTNSIIAQGVHKAA